MDIASTGPVALAERRLSWLDARQQVLAANVANADTPGYRPSDIMPFSQFLGQRARGPLALTDGRHLAPQTGLLSPRPDRAALERTPNGNAVSLDEQALRIADTDHQHAVAMSVHRKYLALFRTALGRNA